MTKLSRMKKEDLELYSYTDLAKMIKKDSNQNQNNISKNM